jgi:enoyl-CoA hydratase/carnithine racemase
MTLNRPEILNALTLDDLTTLRDAVRSISRDVRAIVLTGAGDRAFSAGMHLETFADLTPTSSRRVIEQVGDCISAIRLAPVATVAMINGYCLGAAFEMALACDIRTAHPDVRFGLPEVKLGIPSVVEAALLPHYVGLSKAKEMILTGDLYAAADLPPGFVNRSAPADQLRAVTESVIRALTTPTREVIAAQKSLFETWLNSGLVESIATSKDVFSQIFDSPATAEAIARYQAGHGSGPDRG